MEIASLICIPLVWNRAVHPLPHQASVVARTRTFCSPMKQVLLLPPALWMKVVV